MKYLCDTHILLWWLNGDGRLSVSVKNILSDPQNIVFVSVASAWEIVIKLKSNRKFQIKTTIEDCFSKSQFTILDIELPHVLQFEKLKGLHRDPFDLILIAQSISEDAILITSDRKIWRYNVHMLKCGGDIQNSSGNFPVRKRMIKKKN